jgi:type II secretory pathway component PulF
MSVYAYVALGKDGRRSTGTLTAESRASAVAQIGKQGLHAISVDEARDAEVAAKKAAALQTAAAAPVRGRVSRRAVEAFTREIANLLAAGIPLSRALALLRREASNPAAKQLWSDIHEDVVGGMSLHETLAKYPKSFSSVYVAMVQAGETGGFLDTVLGQISDFRVREADLKGKVKAALIYPLILAIVASGVVIFLLTFFIPKFQGIFSQFGADLPLLTQVIIGISNAILKFGPYVLVVGIVFFAVFYKSIATQNGRRMYEKAILSTPLLGQVVAHFSLVRFARMLGTLVGAGVPLIASLRVARQAIGNQTLSDTVSRAIEEVQRGQPLSKSLSESPLLFPASVVEMIAVAEETGRLDKELLRMAVSYESDLDRQLRMLVAVAEPCLLFVMAAIIGTIVVGVLLPLLNLGDVIH